MKHPLKAFNFEEMLQNVGVFFVCLFFSSNFCNSLEIRNFFAVSLGKWSSKVFDNSFNFCGYTEISPLEKRVRYQSLKDSLGKGPVESGVML